MSETLPTRYDFASAEARWYTFWEKRGFFRPRPGKGRFVIMMPPPNITGILHMGHVLNNTIQDVLVRWHRMKGEETLWQPGIDHAGIATMNKVEQEIAKEGKTRFDVGREEFIKRTWAWKEKYGGTIIEQLRRLGCSADWENLVFTMDPGYTRAVLTAFVELFNSGLIYRGKRLINWCPRCKTALSDDEVEREDKASHLWYIRYPFAEGEGFLTVATTRPETYLGDTAVAVNPKDARFSGLIGKRLRLPLVDWERRDTEGRAVYPEVPIIAHSAVDPDFGTGAVKVTPAHDPADYEIAKDENLPLVQVIDQSGIMTENAGPFAGLTREEARERVVAELEKAGFLEKVEGYTVPLGTCYRCGTAIEPLLSEQWFVRMKELAGPATEAVRSGRVKIIPEYGQKIFFNWMDNIRDWCISRQIWWGHRVPIYYCDGCGEIFASVDKPEKCPKCNSVNIRQDEDVLDTWASSWLWPFGTLGWPDRAERLLRYYPGDVLVTGWEILFLWVARMMMAGARFMGEMPFHTVYLHGIVRDERGRKMEKSLGNSPDPLDLFREYSVDGVRMGILFITPEGRDVLFSLKSCEIGRNFANKLWNAARLVLSNAGGEFRGLPQELRLEDKWILSRLDAAILRTNELLEAYELNGALKTLYDFLWAEFCDWYLEAIKPRLQSGDRGGIDVALFVLDVYLRLLHPFMPFITEELWQALPNRDGESVMIAPWPEPLGKVDAGAEKEFDALREMVSGVREIRGTFRVPKGAKLRLFFRNSPEAMGLALENRTILEFLAGIEGVSESADPPAGSALIPSKSFEAYVTLSGIIDTNKEKSRLEKEIAELSIQVERMRARLSDPDFLQKAPSHLVQEQKLRFSEMEAKLERLREQAKRL
ncbi:MAG: valine--tRNA ligase [candidate division WOR-3 bacterium]